MRVNKRMCGTWQMTVFLFSMLMLAVGCQTGNRKHTEELVTLQQQVAVLTRELEEARERLNTLQDSMEENHKELSSLRAEVARFNAGGASASARVEAAKEQPPASVAPEPPHVQPVTCAQVWKLLGQGKDEATVARTLNIAPERVQACERQVGRARPQR